MSRSRRAPGVHRGIGDPRLAEPARPGPEVGLVEDVRRGLGAQPRSLPPKWLYDDRGSQLFDEITRLPEYYPTEAERSILQVEADAIVAGS